MGDFGNVNWTCEQRNQYVDEHCIEFFASERWLDTTLCPSHFIYITMIRHPIKRIESNCRFENVPTKLAMEWLTRSHFPDQRVFLGDNQFSRPYHQLSAILHRNSVCGQFLH